MSDVFLGFMLISMVLVVAYFIKGIMKRNKTDFKKVGIAGGTLFVSFVLFGITAPETEESASNVAEVAVREEPQEKEKAPEGKKPEKEAVEEKITEDAAQAEEKSSEKSAADSDRAVAATEIETKEAKPEDIFAGYQVITVAGGNQSGHREANVAVNIGFGDREYWAFTNEHGQLTHVIADEIVLQDEVNEAVTSQGRYFYDEAKVPGTESSDLDEGHVIADSLGGVGNAYNITPQDSTMNRHGDQAYMERSIRGVGGAKGFEAIITYPNTDTQIPSHYQYTYTIQGEKVVDSFANVDPDEYNESQGLTSSEPKEGSQSTSEEETKANTSAQDVTTVDTNGNGTVTIAEAKDAGFSMPITTDHWIYPYMIDRDGDGMVGE
ncbi:DNA/RNA non-specific endonuclease [Lacticigenium naphthae]|uniref:DNA/RNA non-specific endonuclease n=1 Tax=Lacticigenium naphthae TaxID=515351 RepID=UPI000481BF28|nr:DNA/RNA non-specific endonuclease [Lacticigenium naphthae]